MSNHTLSVITTILDFLAFVGVIAALVYQARMARSAREQVARAADANMATVYQNIAHQMHEIDLLFVERPALRQYFQEDVEPPTEGEDEGRVAAIAELFVDFMDNVETQCPLLEKTLQLSWRGYFCDLYARSPAIRHFWALRSAWYAGDAPLISLMDEAKQGYAALTRREGNGAFTASESDRTP